MNLKMLYHNSLYKDAENSKQCLENVRHHVDLMSRICADLLFQTMKLIFTFMLFYIYQDFQFKLLTRLRIFTAQGGTFTSAVNLVATANKYGLIFVGCPTGIQGMV